MDRSSPWLALSLQAAAAERTLMGLTGRKSHKVIILEGISGCGKSTLNHPLNALTNYRDLVVPRFTPSMWVFNQLYGRPEVDYEPLNQAIQATHELHVIWLKATPLIACLRQQIKQDPRTEDLAKAHSLFRRYFEEVTTLGNVHHVWTDSQSIEATVAEIKMAVYPELC